MVAGSPKPGVGPRVGGDRTGQARRPSGEAMGVNILGRGVVQNRAQSYGLGAGGAAPEMGTQGKNKFEGRY